MKKVLAFLLTAAIALGGLVFAHAAVFGSQDELIIYPTAEVGDSTILDGLTANLTFTCGNHLRWHASHTFGGKTRAEFVYDRKGTQEPTSFHRNQLSLGLSGGVSISTDGGFPVMATDYGQMLQAVADDTPAGGSGSKTISMSDYAAYYRPDYSLFYEDAAGYCSEGFDLSSWTIGEIGPTERGAYENLRAAFRFPVQPGDAMSITVEKNDAGQLCSVHFYPENSPELYLVSDVNGQGIWFVPIFRDTSGNPLPYESPAGHGIYFIPWKQTNSILYAGGLKSNVLTPDVSLARLLIPLDQQVSILHLEIDADAGIARMLSFDSGSYLLTVFDLEQGQILDTLELFLPEAAADPGGYFLMDEGYLLAVLADRIALVDAETNTLLLTAPAAAQDTDFCINRYNPDTGCLRFDGKSLMMIDVEHISNGCFWSAAWQQDALIYYGLYDCSLMGGNDNPYYQLITADAYPIILN